MTLTASVRWVHLQNKRWHHSLENDTNMQAGWWQQETCDTPTLTAAVSHYTYQCLGCTQQWAH